MRVTFLGTGTSQGIPVIACDCEVCSSLDFRDKRLRTSIHLQKGHTSVVIDTGPDFRQQMLAARINELSAVVFTHQHKDHVAGLDDIRPYNFRYKMDMPIYATDQVIEHLRGEFPYIFVDHEYPGVPKILVNEIGLDSFDIGTMTFLPIEVLHYKLPVLGFRIEDFTYITDANYISDNEKQKILGSKVLVINALQIEPHVSHFNLQEALDLVEELQPEKAYFTHISHKLGLHEQVSKQLPDNVMIAHDGLILDL